MQNLKLTPIFKKICHERNPTITSKLNDHITLGQENINQKEKERDIAIKWSSNGQFGHFDQTPGP